MSDLVALLKAVSTLGGLRAWFHFLCEGGRRSVSYLV